ncbi:prolipoprotein diacylglyceryl transferase [Trueperella pyogenes]|uniref:prolipoprotein diacylglyceryl transferase n=1 Tax=Trueperella pyogenes TaxID=1661 RepID=UPI0023DD997C|nr:prolipoprotein diacylglyceryl transferase [Trueperella pyogenes]
MQLLTAIPSPGINGIELGPLTIHFYALFILTGIFVAWQIGDRRYTRWGGPKDVSLDVAVWAVLFGIVGARIYHVITTPDPYWGPHGDPLKALRIWEGGLGIWGGIAAGALGCYIALHRRGLRFAPFADALAPGILVAQAIGRLGNYFNQELFGRPTDLPWGLMIDDAHLPSGYASGTLFHPTFLYEMLWCLAMAVILIAVEKKFRLRGGQTAMMYVIVYVLGRVWIENIRIDTAQIIWGLRLNVWMSIFVFIAAVLVFIVLTRLRQSNLALANIYLDGREPHEDRADAVGSTAQSESAMKAEDELAEHDK